MSALVVRFFKTRIRGVSPAEVSALVLLIVMMLGVYMVKTRAGVEAARINDLNRQLADEERDVRILRDQVGRLEQPARIERLSQQYLGMQPVSARQEAGPQDLTEIARGGGAVDVSKTTQSAPLPSSNNQGRNTQTATAAPASPAEARR